MRIQPMSNVAFKGSIKVVDDVLPIVRELDCDKILSFDTRMNNTQTLIKYDVPHTVKHNGYEWQEPTTITVPYNLDTILTAYNAAKDKPVTVDLSELSYRKN